MMLDKEFEARQKTSEDNMEFIRLLCKAEDVLTEALGQIKYPAFPTVNKGMIGDIESIIGNISRIEYNITAGHTHLLKPVKLTSVGYYYKLDYSRGREDNGSIYLETNLKIEDFEYEAAFLEALFSENTINGMSIDNILSIEEIDKKTFEEANS